MANPKRVFLTTKTRSLKLFFGMRFTNDDFLSQLIFATGAWLFYHKFLGVELLHIDFVPLV